VTLDHLDTIISFVAILAGASLLVTTLTQTGASLLSLRGVNLRWAVETLIKHADPELKDHAREISDRVLQHGLLSDSAVSGGDSPLTGRSRLATVVRKDELIDILHSFAHAPVPVSPAGAPPAPPAPEWATALKKSLTGAEYPAVAAVISVAPDIAGALPLGGAAARTVVTEAVTAGNAVTDKIDRWFDSVMDRASQRFALHTRILTVVFSLLLVVGLHLDTFRLIPQLSADSELRSRVLAGADALTRKADDILATSTNTPATAYTDAMVTLIAAHPVELKGLDAPAGFKDDAGAKEWLNRELATAHVANPDTWVARYDELVPQAALRSSANQFYGVLGDNLRFRLVPDPYPPFSSYWTPNWMHLAGTLATAALLSLGAPFWFNTLKDLCNLRPVLAKKQEAESAPGAEDAGSGS
jgi:hypothetical protein